MFTVFNLSLKYRNEYSISCGAFYLAMMVFSKTMIVKKNTCKSAHPLYSMHLSKNRTTRKGNPRSRGKKEFSKITSVPDNKAKRNIDSEITRSATVAEIPLIGQINKHNTQINCLVEDLPKILRGRFQNSKWFRAPCPHCLPLKLRIVMP